jgi:hypothetical protein
LSAIVATTANCFRALSNIHAASVERRRPIIACWLDEFFDRAGIEHASSGAEALKAIDERCPERTQMRKSLMTGAAGVNEQRMLTN